MRSKLAQIFRIQGYLNDIKYPDPYRIAREISQLLSSKKRISETDIFERLHRQEPWDYVRGYTRFCDNDFRVSKDTLIPRVETEQLVYECKKIIEKNNIKNIVDVGTGTGCIAISLANLLKNPLLYSFYGSDISKEAIKIAKYNEKKILKTNRIKWLNTNLIKSVPKLDEDTIIIANLPYIPSKIYKKLDSSVLKYEPQLALDGGKTGLQLYSQLFEQITQKEINVKYIFIETQESNFKESKKLVKKFFPESTIRGIKDCFDKDRFLKISII